MTISRITQQMTSARAIANVQKNMTTLATYSEQVSSGKRINRPSDDPIGTAQAMNLRTSLADQSQYSSNASDGLGWLSAADTALGSASDELLDAYQDGVKAVNGALNDSDRDSLAQEVENARSNLLALANTTYQDRPIFGGVTSGTTAYDSSGSYTGTDGAVNREVGDNVTVKVNVDASASFGTTSGSTVFDKLTALANAIRSGNTDDITAATSAVTTARTQIVAARSDAGLRYNSITSASDRIDNTTLSLKSSLSDVEDVDTAEAYTQLSLQEVTYKAALSATSSTLSLSLSDFLR